MLHPPPPHPTSSSFSSLSTQAQIHFNTTLINARLFLSPAASEGFCGGEGEDAVPLSLLPPPFFLPKGKMFQPPPPPPFQFSHHPVYAGSNPPNNTLINACLFLPTRWQRNSSRLAREMMFTCNPPPPTPELSILSLEP